MARQFDVPDFYKSPLVSKVKGARQLLDPRKKDLSPSVLDFGPVRFKLARHFGFCYGVENAIEIAYKAISEANGRRIFLLSEMIHNPHVNEDLKARGIQFLRTTSGKQLIPFSELKAEDIVIIPAFGTTLETQQLLTDIGVDVEAYNTTCPFVEKVWNRSSQIGTKNYTVVVHGKRYHEETRATVSHAQAVAPVIVVRDLEEAEKLASVVRGEKNADYFFEHFSERYSPDFDPNRDLQRLGVVNQTTMLATETTEIAALLKQAVLDRDGGAELDSFADTSDTLCYATNENQDATRFLINEGADLAIIVGGTNSSNTSHLVELCEEVMPTYFVSGDSNLISNTEIRHFNYEFKRYERSHDWLPNQKPVDILLTAGASCPDVLLDRVMERICSWFPDTRSAEETLQPFMNLNS
ncbi:MAG: 4-hydroxy-3-methylbut-2-enyl diphosphate reductase [Rhodothermales bacterium]|nr:4-hydroxy-3-methylbut-2-enyl diphosphate reductase [Rhodothermales bacterium]MDG2015746.1 4-hydroxy-3-methylbut-2-enyl diphosphate reductase [Rhodothermales bacterium]